MFFTTTVFSQEQQISNADNKFENLNYYESLTIYKKLLKKGYRTAEIYQKIGDSYYYNGDYLAATSYYKSLFGLKKPVAVEYYFRYIQGLKAQKKYDLVDKILNEIPENLKSDSRFKLYQNNKSYLSEIKSVDLFKIDTTSINSPYSDFGAFVYENKFYFASSRDTSGIISRKHTWTNQSFLKLYEVEISESGYLMNPIKLKTNFSKSLNQSSAIISKDGKTMFFTQNNSEGRKRIKNKKEKTLLKIFKATYDGKEWNNAIELPFNSDDYNCAHPALSMDEKFLYFSSDMPGTIGGSDIYKVEILTDGNFGKPLNLGPKINTEGRETFPFISADNKLYFASDGRPGLGGLDIYRTSLDDTDDYTTIENLGGQINSNSDDFAFFINAENNRGFFSSNRTKGVGFDDIYKFTKQEECDKLFEVVIIDSESRNPIDSALVTFSNKSGEKMATLTVNAEGKVFFKIICDQAYFINIKKEGYESQEQLIMVNNMNRIPEEFILEKTLKPMKVGDDLTKILSINDIYFDLDKFNIRPDAEYELTKILLILEQEPQMEINIRSHTDSRASKDYNQKLSTNRAHSTMQWLIRNGISANRLKSEGFGESRLLNHCSDGVDCSEEEHQLNRRSEFIITKI